MQGFRFDPNEVEDDNDSGGFQPVPDGVYSVIIDSAEIKDTRRGDGKYLSLAFRIVSMKNHGRLIFNNYNFINPSEKAVQIARKEMKKLCKAVGINREITNINEFLNRELDLRVKVEEYEYNGKTGRSNKIMEYIKHPVESTPPGINQAKEVLGGEVLPF
tara:strand:+ start:1618 stop:2097 length:480 start_codon:yes stop_codon:yes gene_type:complete